MDEAYVYQMWKMMDIQHEIKKIQSVSGVLAIREYEIQLKVDYFAKVVSLFDTWHFRPIKSDTYDHEVCGYINKKKFLALCTDHELIDLLSGNMKNFSKERPQEQCIARLSNRQVDPSIMKMLENVFGKGNA